MTRKLTIPTPQGKVSAAFTPAGEGALVLVVAHGAGGSLHDPLLAGFAAGLGGEGIASLRFNFGYREAGRRAPDREPALRDVWRAAFARAERLGGPVWAGGKSLGGRIASMMAADGDIAPAGLVFVGYPLHPPGKPERIRDAHLPAIGVPMLFLQGTADPFATPDLLDATIARLPGATLHTVEGGDHSFRVRGRPKDDEGTGRALAAVAAAFIRG